MISIILVIVIFLFSWSVYEYCHPPKSLKKDREITRVNHDSPATKVIVELMDERVNDYDEDRPTVVMPKKIK